MYNYVFANFFLFINVFLASVNVVVTACNKNPKDLISNRLKIGIHFNTKVSRSHEKNSLKKTLKNFY